MDSKATPTRLHRYVRHRHRKPVFVPQVRDHEIIRVVSEHRVISSDDLQLLVSGSNQTILRRLQKLFHNGYLDRPRSQRQRGNTPMVYALGQCGAELLAREAGKRPANDWSEKNRLIGFAYLEHALMVSHFHSALRYAIREEGMISLERWIGDGAFRDAVSVEHEAGTERIPIAPDALFTLRLISEPEGRNRIHVFLEADRGTMTTKRFFAKMRGYWHYWLGGKQEDRLRMKNFLVVTVTKTPERAESLCAVTRALDAPRHRGLRMFLFGSEQSYALSEPERVLDSVWATAGDVGHHSLLE